MRPHESPPLPGLERCQKRRPRSRESQTGGKHGEYGSSEGAACEMNATYPFPPAGHSGRGPGREGPCWSKDALEPKQPGG